MSTRRILIANEERATEVFSDLVERAISTTVDTDSALEQIKLYILDASPEVQRSLLIKAARQAIKRRVRAREHAAVRRADSIREREGKPTQVWTDELLAAEFALPDGTRVAWGEATIEQHETRRAMFAQQADGIDRAYRRHTSAQHAIREHRARNLYEALSPLREKATDV